MKNTISSILRSYSTWLKTHGLCDSPGILLVQNTQWWHYSAEYAVNLHILFFYIIFWWYDYDFRFFGIDFHEYIPWMHSVAVPRWIRIVNLSPDIVDFLSLHILKYEILPEASVKSYGGRNSSKSSRRFSMTGLLG